MGDVIKFVYDAIELAMKLLGPEAILAHVEMIKQRDAGLARTAADAIEELRGLNDPALTALETPIAKAGE